MLPLSFERAHRVGDTDTSVIPRMALNVGAAVSNQPTAASGAVHCALHCTAQVLLPALLLCAVLLPFTSSTLPVYTQFYARLSAPPLLPPPRTH